MTTIQLGVSTQQLLQAIENLSTEELEKFAEGVSILRAKRLAPSVEADEATLLKTISGTALSADDLARFNILSTKLEAETISDAERAELLALNETVEANTVARLTHIIELAKLRQQTVEQVMEELQLWNPHAA